MGDTNQHHKNGMDLLSALFAPLLTTFFYQDFLSIYGGDRKLYFNLKILEKDDSNSELNFPNIYQAYSCTGKQKLKDSLPKLEKKGVLLPIFCFPGKQVAVNFHQLYP